jgi:phosphatidylglycerol lysyltransferase
LQGLMYTSSFASVHTSLPLSDAIILFLKRNLISVFLPAGGVSSLAFYTRSIEKKGISKTQIYFASSIYGFVGILSVVIVAFPAFIIALTRGSVGKNEWIALASTLLILGIVYWFYKTIQSKGRIYNIIIIKFPKLEIFLDEFQNQSTRRRYILLTVIYSVLIEFIGIAHVYVTMLALGFTPSLFTAIISYLIVVLFLIISPFLRGLGAIEVSMTYVLVRFGYNHVEAIAIMALFRFFEFWLPLFSGLISFVLKIDKLLMRVLPSILLLFLGVINIVSVLTPAITERMQLLKDLLFPEIVYSSNLLVLITGVFLLITAVFMMKGLRITWWFALLLSITSLLGHLTKGIDFEEAGIALFVILILVLTRREYYIKTNPRLRILGLQTAFFTMITVIIYGIIGFYFLDKKHFNVDFNLVQSIRYTLQNFLLIGSNNLVPENNFARDFIWTIKGSGVISMLFMIYMLVRPYVLKEETSEEEFDIARHLVEINGKSPLDYFKTYPDKLIFFCRDRQAFLAYRVSRNYAVILEDPVAPDKEKMSTCIEEFSRYCYENGLKDIYYRVPFESLPVYNALRKKSMFLGQEAVLDTYAFTLEGRDVKSIRNATRKITEIGYRAHIHKPPLLDGTIQKLKAVSNDWLHSTGRREIVFSQGVFDEAEIKYQTVLSVENPEEKIIAFLNIIPDFAPDEGTYDLLRKTSDAPNGIMDYILVELINYFKINKIQFLNLGFAPLSGINDPHTFPEKSMKFAYNKIRSFSHFKGQRDYKEKFKPVWHDKYLVYSQDYDLIQAPGVLSNVIKP